MQTLSFSFVPSLKSFVVPRQKNNPKHFRSNSINSSYVAPTKKSAQTDVVTHPNKVDGNNDEEKYAKVGLQHKEALIPKHVAASLDGNRRWVKHHGLELDYRPFFQANMRFAKYCLKWGVSSGTSFMISLGNIKYRTKEANDLFIEQFTSFLEEGLEQFIRDGVKVSIVGELSIVPESCQATIKKVEEATKNNTTLDLMLPLCYTAQRDIVEATKKICSKVHEGTMKLEDVNEDLFEQQLSLSGSRPPIDLFIRTGGQIRIGNLLGWQLPHVELYFNDTYAPDFGEDMFLDALRSFQQRERWFSR